MQREIDRIFHQSPRAYGIERTRWRLPDLEAALPWLAGYSPAGVAGALQRLNYSRKRALNFIRSPDPEYARKEQAIAAARAEARQQPGRVVLVYLDELTYFRNPSLAPAYAPRGKAQPRARQVPGANTQTRIVAALEASSARVTYLQRSKVGESALVRFYAQLRLAYPEAETLYVVQDNWPNHKLPAVLAAMAQAQLTPLFLPTYASWLNPIEKLWKWLKQAVLHLHPDAEDVEALRQRVRRFLDQFQTGSIELLTYVGLLSD